MRLRRRPTDISDAEACETIYVASTDGEVPRLVGAHEFYPGLPLRTRLAIFDRLERRGYIIRRSLTVVQLTAAGVATFRVE